MIALNLLRRWLVAGLCVLAGCAVSQPEVPMRAFLSGDLTRVRDFAANEAEHGAVENQALVLNVQAECELLLGDLDNARKHFETAAQIMGTWQVSSGEVNAAILGSESSKTYKGDPYEKCMNAFYAAYCFLRHGEPDNARACCKRGILADGETADEKFQADDALLFWMAGRMSVLMGSADADGFFREAATAHAFALEHGSRGDPQPAVITQPSHGNLVLLFAVGLGPEKYEDGAFAELARFRSRPQPAVRAAARLDGAPIGRSTILCDVDYQARTLGGTAMEGIRKGKAVFKAGAAVSGIVLLDQAAHSHGDKARTEAIVGGGLLLASLFTSTAADVRHWPTLPSTVQVLAADAPPGPHRVDVEFFDAAGRTLPSLRQSREVDVPATGEAWQLFRSLPIEHDSRNDPTPATTTTSKHAARKRKSP